MRNLVTIADLDAALQDSFIRPVVLFKHSPTCGISAQALEEMEFLSADPGQSAVVHIILVNSARAVSNEVAHRFNIRHESPQLLVIADGRVCWHGSHFRATADDVRTALRTVLAPPQESRSRPARLY